jgi:flagellar protein FlaI
MKLLWKNKMTKEMDKTEKEEFLRAKRRLEEIKREEMKMNMASQFELKENSGPKKEQGAEEHKPSLHKLQPHKSAAQKIEMYKQSVPKLKLDNKKERHVPVSNTSSAGSGILEQYSLGKEGAKANVVIKREGKGSLYLLNVPKVDVATQSLLNEVRNELVSLTTVSMKELINPEALSFIKSRFSADAATLLKTKLPSLNKETESFLVEALMQDMLGLGKIEYLIEDSNLEEIVITSSKEPIRVYSKKYGWLETNLVISKEEDIINYSNIIARRIGRQITILTPLLDAHLVTGDRINAVLYPINTKGNTITIRKFARDPYSIIDLIKNNTCDLETAAVIWLAMEYEMNVIISGGTASGKTVFLNACLPFIPPNQRIISIEDTRELMLPEFLYWTPLITRTPNPEGKGEVSMLDLLVNSLRMRPDRIVLGEMRKREEAMVLFEAMHTGHSVYATLHADSAAETIARLVNQPLNVPPNLLKSINLNVVMFRDRKKGIRRVLHVAEIETEKENAKANILYRWVPEEDKIVKHAESSRFFEDLSRNTGMSEGDIEKSLQERVFILDWLAKKNIRSLNDFGSVMNSYYKSREKLVSAMKAGNINSILKNNDI